MAFKIHTGTANKPCVQTGVVLPHPVWTVVETRGTRVVETRQFFDSGEASDYVQRCLMMDRDFAMEGR
jgi:hypothetical protein